MADKTKIKDQIHKYEDGLKGTKNVVEHKQTLESKLFSKQNIVKELKADSKH